MTRTGCVSVGVALVLAIGACPASASKPGSLIPSPGWISSWVSAQQIPEPRNALASGDLDKATLRQVIRTTLGGSRVRLRVSNVYGTAPLTVGQVSIARSADPKTSGVDVQTLEHVTFSQHESVTIPAGAYIVSDAVDLRVEPLTHLVVSMYFPREPEQQTGHPGSRATSYVQAGNRIDEQTLPDAKPVDHWYQLAGLDVDAIDSSRALVIIGDSITDGHGVSANTDRRWTDFLVARVQGDRELRCSLAVLNVGLGGNRMLLDGLGPNGLARFDRDVLDRPGTRYVLVLLGVNDLGTLARDETASQRDHDQQVDQLVAAYEQMISRARENGIRIIGGTIMPFRGSTYYPSDDATEAARNRVNAWIRAPGHFDAVIDFDKRMQSPEEPSKLNPPLDSGDHLHPSIAGYKAMGDFVSLDLFRDASAGAPAADCMASR